MSPPTLSVVVKIEATSNNPADAEELARAVKAGFRALYPDLTLPAPTAPIPEPHDLPEE